MARRGSSSSAEASLSDLESTNLAIAQEMSSTKFVSLKTFIGQEKKFSTIPISQLKIGTY
jgi:hypothetical protein